MKCLVVGDVAGKRAVFAHNPMTSLARWKRIHTELRYQFHRSPWSPFRRIVGSVPTHEPEAETESERTVFTTTRRFLIGAGTFYRDATRFFLFRTLVTEWFTSRPTSPTALVVVRASLISSSFRYGFVLRWKIRSILS